jgi:hypothetical protein
VSDPAAKAKTQLNLALVRLDQAARHAREAGLPEQADRLERLAREAAEVLDRLQPTPEASPVDQVGDHNQGAAT